MVDAVAVAMRPADEWARLKGVAAYLFAGAVQHAKLLMDDNSGRYRSLSEADFDAAIAAVRSIVLR